MVAWFKHDIPAWMDGTEDLPDGAYRAYHVICQLIYLHEGPIALNEHGIAGRCHQHVLTFRKNLKTLIDAGKLTLVDGRLSNDRAAIELQQVANQRATSGKGGRGSSGVAKRLVGGSPEVDPRLTVGQSDNPLKTNNVILSPLFDHEHHKTRLEKTREEEAPLAPSSPEKDYFARCRQVLGDRHGGPLGAKLLSAKSKNIAIARAAIETASTKDRPREYIGAIINRRDAPEDLRARGEAW